MIASVGKLQNNDPDDWICGRAGAMKSIIGDSVRTSRLLSFGFLPSEMFGLFLFFGKFCD